VLLGVLAVLLLVLVGDLPLQFREDVAVVGEDEDALVKLLLLRSHRVRQRLHLVQDRHHAEDRKDKEEEEVNSQEEDDD
jgi:hypothetical protein